MNGPFVKSVKRPSVKTRLILLLLLISGLTETTNTGDYAYSISSQALPEQYLIPARGQKIQEQMPELPNLMENEFDMILSNRWGYLAIGLLAPLSEEIVLRGAILKELLKSSKLSPWGAIVISALFFALIHFNPAQMPHAFIIGLLLGWMYWRTGSILPGVAYHWANNSMAYIIYNIYPDPDMKLIDVFKGSQQHVLMAVGFSLLILVPAIYQLNMWMKRD